MCVDDSPNRNPEKKNTRFVFFHRTLESSVCGRATVPSWHPVRATSLTAAVVVNKRQASSVLQHYRCRATRAPNTDDAQTASLLRQEPSSRSAQSRSRRCSRCRSAAVHYAWLRSSLLFPPHPPSFSSRAKRSLAAPPPQEGIQRRSAVARRRESGAPGEAKLSQSAGHVLRRCSCCCFLTEGSCQILRSNRAFDFPARQGLSKRLDARSRHG